MRALGILALISILAGCSSAPRRIGAEREATPPIVREEALAILEAHLAEHPELTQWAKDEPFYVGHWNGYVAMCEAEDLIHAQMSGWREMDPIVIVFRKPFLPIGGGREDFFIIHADRSVYHIHGLAGR
jgi:hypothetical protein